MARAQDVFETDGRLIRPEWQLRAPERSATDAQSAPVVDPELPLDLRKTGHLGCSMTLVSAVIFPVTQRPRAGCERGADVQVAGGKRLTMHPVLIGELVVASIRCNCAL